MLTFCPSDPNTFSGFRVKGTFTVSGCLRTLFSQCRCHCFQKSSCFWFFKKPYQCRHIGGVRRLSGKSFSGLEVDHGKAVASAFAGMTVGEFSDYIQEFKQQPMLSYEGMLRGDGWYLPMLQVVDHLRQNDFTVYVVSGTDRLIVRGIVLNSPLGLPNRQLIGSDETIVSSNQGDTDGLNYVFAEGDELVLGGDFLIKNLKMNKVSVIMQEIGQQPVLSFGNSTGDSSMAEYVTSNNPYRSLAFMLCCDDTQRENGNLTKAEKMFALCEEFDWVPVSMKNDWITIYGDGVTYLPGAAS